MRSRSTLVFACLTAFGCLAMADNSVRPVSYPGGFYAEVARDALTTWQPRVSSPRDGRLSHLQRSRCAVPGGCEARAREFDLAERDYIRALDLVTYGPMNLKFTGNRVKLKVRF